MFSLSFSLSRSLKSISISSREDFLKSKCFYRNGGLKRKWLVQSHRTSERWAAASPIWAPSPAPAASAGVAQVQLPSRCLCVPKAQPNASSSKLYLQAQGQQSGSVRKVSSLLPYKSHGLAGVMEAILGAACVVLKVSSQLLCHQQRFLQIHLQCLWVKLPTIELAHPPQAQGRQPVGTVGVSGMAGSTVSFFMPSLIYSYKSVRGGLRKINLPLLEGHIVNEGTETTPKKRERKWRYKKYRLSLYWSVEQRKVVTQWNHSIILFSL